MDVDLDLVGRVVEVSWVAVSGEFEDILDFVVALLLIGRWVVVNGDTVDWTLSGDVGVNVFLWYVVVDWVNFGFGEVNVFVDIKKESMDRAKVESVVWEAVLEVEI